MNIVPKQIEADEAVINYWLKKLSWRPAEFASLYCGVNPIAYEAFELRALKAIDFEISPNKIQDVKDICRLIDDRLEVMERICGTPSHWKALATKLELAPLDWFSKIVKPPEIPEKPTYQSTVFLPQKEGRLGVSTSDIASAFSGLKWEFEEWKTYLASPAPWLKSTRISKGLQGRQSGGGRKQNMWDPVKIAATLASENISTRKISKAFKFSPAMQEWIDDWEEYKETHYPDQ